MKRPAGFGLVLFAVIVVCGTSWDLYSKSAVFTRYGGPEGEIDPVRSLAGGWATFQLQTSFNAGALFGLGQGLTWLFALLSVVAVAGVVYWLVRLEGRRSRWLTVALALIMAGTLGNLYDRLGLHGEQFPPAHERADERRYAVRDFLLFTFGRPETPMHQRYHYPIFNFADAFLVTGAVMLVLRSFREDRDEEASDDGLPEQAGVPPENGALPTEPSSTGRDSHRE